MDPDSFRAAVESARETELERLGSVALLPASTGGDVTPETLLAAAADSEHAARETFRGWADSEDDATARGAFASVAGQEDDHRRRVLDALDDPGYEPSDGGPLHAYLRGRESTVERIAGGMIGRPLVSLRTHARLISFFDTAGAESRADLFRDLRSETAAVLDDGLALLADRCHAESDREAARAVASYTVTLAYDDFADALADLGRGFDDD